MLSDSHGDVSSMYRIASREKPDMIYHLGDHIRDARELAADFSDIPLRMVVGNCDWGERGDKMLLDDVEGTRIFAGHGHAYNVKSGDEGMKAAARRMGADVLLYGHTHRAVSYMERGLWVMNPGSASSAEGGSYGVILLENGQAMCYTVS